MQIIIIDNLDQTRNLVQGRVESALLQTGIKRISITSGDTSILTTSNPIEESHVLGFIGPGSLNKAEEIISKFKLYFPNCPLTLILDNDRYVAEAVELRRELQIRTIPIADIAQIAQVIFDWQSQLGIEQGIRNLGVIAVTQLSGGVGTSSLTLALASCWAHNNLSVAVIDLDDINPTITTWGKISSSRRNITTELLSIGRVPKQRLKEILEYLEQYSDHLAIIGQPENYRDSFHFKADIIENAPSAADFIESLIEGLKEKFDVIIADTGKSWGISTLSILRRSQHVLFTSSCNYASLHHSLENLKRLSRESNDKEEFNFPRWRIILNQVTNYNGQFEQLENEIQNIDLFSSNVNTLLFIPFSSAAQYWCMTNTSFYDLAEQNVKNAIEKIASSIIPFTPTKKTKPSGGFLRKFLSLS